MMIESIALAQKSGNYYNRFPVTQTSDSLHPTIPSAQLSLLTHFLPPFRKYITLSSS
jgi:hypothetical protein